MVVGGKTLSTRMRRCWEIVEGVDGGCWFVFGLQFWGIRAGAWTLVLR
jgi:hypothetical protein